MSELVVVRYAEIFLKGQNRRFFEQRLERNIRQALAKDGRVTRLHGRIVVDPGAIGARNAIERLTRVFGVASLSPARVVPQRLLTEATAPGAETPPLVAALGTAAVELVREELARRGGEPRFKVETRRSEKRFPMPSPAISREVGGQIHEALGLPVDVRDPELVVGVEVGVQRCFAFVETVPGPGGLPVGTGGRVLSLLSGGIDSPVAAWLATKRGCRVEAIYFHSFPYTGDRTKEKVQDLCRALATWHGPLPLWVVHFTDVQKALRAAGPGELGVVLYRRMMLRIATERARLDGSLALCTGESLGQVASQTLENLAVIDDATTLPVLRPLIAADKAEIIALARRIGTYDISVRPYDDCCSLFVPRHPANKARLQHVQEAEASLDVTAMAHAAAATAERILVTPER